MKKNIFLWSLYDFANSIIMIVFLFYFSQWIVVDSGKPDWWYNATLVVSSILFILTAPSIGRRIDMTGNKISGLRWTTVITIGLYAVTTGITLFAPSQVLLAVILFTLALYFYLMSFVYYTPMMNDLSTEANRSQISGIGEGANYVGQVFGLLVTLPFATGSIYLFGTHGRVQALLPSLVLFALLALPMLIWYKEKHVEKDAEAFGEASGGSGGAGKISLMNEYRGIVAVMKRIFSIKNLFYLFVGYFLFSDALLTFSNNFPIFLEKVHGVSDAAKTYLSVGILLLAGVGSWAVGKIADWKGKKPVMIFLLASWCIILPLIAFVHSFTLLVIICLAGGFIFGPVWGVSRAMVADYTPPDMAASSFSFYIIAERFATFIGPIAWSVVLASTASSGKASYSYGLISLAVLVFVGLLFTMKIKSKTVAK
ncbi:MAG: hypothetical protein JWO73_537 [Candidatus Taylorbacteria bacterium]|nr:hypothetical protein [Candidatus Taylorbacteria bacterium]